MADLYLQELENELDFLKGKDYVESTQQQQWKISATEIKKTESMCNNFVEYIKTHNVEDSSYFEGEVF